MKKQKELMGNNALQFVDDVESTKETMELTCESIYANCYVGPTTSEYFLNALANCPERQEEDRKYYENDTRKKLVEYLVYFHKPVYEEAKTAAECVKRAYRIAINKFAERLAFRYGIEL